MGWKAGGAFIKFFFVIGDCSNLFRQSYKGGYGGVKATSISQVELEMANPERKKNSDFFLIEAFSITFTRPVGGQSQFNPPC